MISESTHCDKAFEKYQNILAHNEISFQRMTFSEGLKKTFRTRIACGKIDETNQAFEALTGYLKEELKGKGKEQEDRGKERAKI